MASTGRKYTVYMHTTPSGKRYIGITSQTVKARWESGHGYRTCSYFWNAVCKYGWDSIDHHIISEGLTGADAKRLEKELIVFYKTRDPAYGYNLTSGGDGLSGFSQSDETRKKISEAQKGRMLTAEHRAKISAANKGKQSTLGMKYTDKAKQNMRDGWSRRAREVECLTKSGEVVGRYISCADAAEKTGLRRSSISRVCCGSRKTTGKFRWRFV
jgi:group I intron endonuclease